MIALPDYQEAVGRALKSALPLSRFENIGLESSCGRVLAQPVNADRDLPPFNRAQMDGYALRAAEYAAGKAWRVAATIPAGAPSDVVVPAGECIAVATGAPLPEGLDTVIQHELSDRGDREGGLVRFTSDRIERGHAVHARGADAKAGDMLIGSGVTLQPQHLGIAAAVGATSLAVAAKPRIAVLTSGDEVVPAGAQVQPHQIRNSNGPMIGELVQRMGAQVIRTGHVRDDPDATIRSVRDAIADSDLVITIGGVSAGDRDFFPAAMRACGVRFTLEGASIQPGKPVMVGRTASGNPAVTISLPGNPVSALACACLFVWPAIRVMLGLDGNLPWRTAALAQAVKPNAHRRAFRPAILEEDGRVRIPAWAGSGDLAHTAATHGLAELPIQSEPEPIGAAVRFLPWPA